LSLVDLVFIAGALAAAYVEISLRMALNHATFGAPFAPVVPTLIFLAAVGFIGLSFRLRTSPGVTRVFRTLGLATYPLYLLHDVTGAAILRWLLDAGLGRWEALGVAMASVIAASIAISQWIEPAVRLALASGLSAVEAIAAPRRARTAPSS
jgi:peptidoglycan/LPS O-acetylase OafA/YrhL